MDRKIRFIVVGTANRGLFTFARRLLNRQGRGRPEFPQRAEVVALVDTNLTRARAAAAELDRPDIPAFTTVDEALRQTAADWAIVTTPDSTHADIVIACLRGGLDVLVDKPLATSVWECDRILQAMRQTKRRVVVGHNYRYYSNALQAARLVRSGALGDILSVDAAEMLSYSHGGDYFHRWHSDFSKSAGLMNHKGCHFIDLINWILNDAPVEVSAMGGRRFYKPRPDLPHGERCLDCGITATCPHFFDLRKWEGILERIYLAPESDDGYRRDLCVFSDRHTICDHEVLNIRYARGVLASFTLITFAPKEYMYMNFTGTAGRLELGSDPGSGGQYLRHYHSNGKVENFDFKTGGGEHGHDAADTLLVADILGMEGSDPIQRATPEEARQAVLVADMAARSIAAGGRPVCAEETGRDFPPQPLVANDGMGKRQSKQNGDK
jgi:predicted dehydrogenase